MELKEGPRRFFSVKFLCSAVGGSFCLKDREKEHLNICAKFVGATVPSKSTLETSLQQSTIIEAHVIVTSKHKYSSISVAPVFGLIRNS